MPPMIADQAHLPWVTCLGKNLHHGGSYSMHDSLTRIPFYYSALGGEEGDHDHNEGAEDNEESTERQENEAENEADDAQQN